MAIDHNMACSYTAFRDVAAARSERVSAGRRGDRLGIAARSAGTRALRCAASARVCGVSDVRQ